MLRDLANALFSPRRFFAGLAARPPSAGRAYLALLLPLMLGSLAQASALDKALARLPSGLAGSAAQIQRPLFVVGILAAAPLGALSLWLFGWMPLRLGVGRRPRLGEVAAWAQLPSAVLSALSTAAFALATPPPLLGVAATLVSEVWCGWLIWEGLGVFARDGRVRGVVAWALLALVAFAFGYASAGLAPSGGLAF